MPSNLNNERKQELCKTMASNLSTLRAKAGLSQFDLADRLGFARQTISAIESKKRDMQWSTFSAIALFFSKDEEIRQLMTVMGMLDDSVNAVFNITYEKENTSNRKKLLMKNLTKNLPILRDKLCINQRELAEKIGVSQQMIVDIENGTREMTWMVFVALTLLFLQNEKTNILLPVADIYTDDLKQFFSFSRDSIDAEGK